MEELINFFAEVGRLKNIPRRGWVLIGIKDPASISDHLFRMALMTWLLGEGKNKPFNLEKAIKMALIHDICELYAGDVTPFDKGDALPQNKDKWPEAFDKWPRFSKEEKENIEKGKREKEKQGLCRMIKSLSSELQAEIMGLWQEYNSGLSREAKFVKQINRLETLFQALEYAKEEGKRPYRSWWIGTKEMVDDPILTEFMETLDKSFSFKTGKGLPKT